MFSCKKSDDNLYQIVASEEELTKISYASDSLLASLLLTLEQKKLKTSSAFSLNKALNTIYENLRNLKLKRLLLKPQKQVSVQTVILAYRELEYLLASSPIKKWREASSAFRTFAAETEFRMSEGTPIGICGYTSMWPHSEKSTSYVANSAQNIRAVRVKGSNYRKAYVVFDPDRYSQLMLEGGLLDESLNKAQKQTQPDYDVLSWKSTLETIARTKKLESLRKLLTTEPSSISPIVLRSGLKEMEDILKNSNSKCPQQKSRVFRSLLSIGGAISNGFTVNEHEFISRFSKHVANETENNGITSVESVLVAFSQKKSRCMYIDNHSSANSRLSETVANLSKSSMKRPITYGRFNLFRKAVNKLNSTGKAASNCAYIFGAKEKDDEQVINTSVEYAVDTLAGNKKMRSAFFRVLVKYSESGKQIQRVYENTIRNKRLNDRESLARATSYPNENHREKAIPIVHPENEELSQLNRSGGILNLCFIRSNWDVLASGSKAKDSYQIRVSISKALRHLLLQEDIPNVYKALSTRPSKLHFNQLYLAYREIEYAMIGIPSGHVLSNSLQIFINRYIDVIADDVKPNCFTNISTAQTMKKVSGKSCPPSELITFQKVKIKKRGGQLVVFDGFHLPGLMLRNSLLYHCLKSSESTRIQYSEAIGIKNTLEYISKNKASSLKHLLNSSVSALTANSVLHGFIELESLLEEKGPIKPNLPSMQFRGFLGNWGGTQFTSKLLKVSGFRTRFDGEGNTICPKPIPLFYQNSDNSQPYLEVNTYLCPPLFREGGVLTEALKTASRRSRSEPFEISELQILLTTIEHIVINLNEAPTIGMMSFLGESLTTCPRNKLLLCLRTIENILELNSSLDHEKHFNTLWKLLTINDERTSDGRLLSDSGFQSRFALSKLHSKVIVTFQVKTKINGRLRQSTIERSITSLSGYLSSHGLLMTSITKAANSSEIAPFFSSEISYFVASINRIVGCVFSKVVNMDKGQRNLPLITLFNSPSSELTIRQVVLGLKRMEDIIDDQQSNYKGKTSELIRRFLSDFGGQISTGIKISECRFRTRFSVRQERAYSELIEPIDSDGSPIPHPIITKHATVSQLKEKLNEYYQAPTDAICRACELEIGLYQELVSCFEPFVEQIEGTERFRYSISTSLWNTVKERATDSRSCTNEMKTLINTYGSDQLLAAYLQLRVLTPSKQHVYCAGKSQLIPEEFKHWFGATGSGMSSFLWSPFILPRQVLLCCFLRISIHTSWNKDAIATLQVEDLPKSLPSASFFIQGYKSKVGKSTKPVEVTVIDHEVRQVIELLIHHTSNMNKLGFTTECIWETPFSKGLTFLSQRDRKDFIKKHHLPQFTIEQLSKHMIKLRLGIDGDIRKSQEERNHSQLLTTAGYADHPLARAFFDANNAEFQRRLEASVQFRFAGEASLVPYGLREVNIDVLLFSEPDSKEPTPQWFLLPDGSSCNDIWSSVDKASAAQKLCSGRRCHTGNGCPHNKVFIGPKELANTLRKQRWYVERGDTLIARYTKDYFEEYIAPEMRFVFGLLSYVKASAPELYFEAEQALHSESEGLL
ncbi:hypothetical protein ACVFI8_13915 [Agarivorans sp. MS3-6]